MASGLQSLLERKLESKRFGNSIKTLLLGVYGGNL